MAITKKGYQLGASLARYYPAITPDVHEILSRICRHAVTHHRIQEVLCSVEMTPASQARIERQDTAIERRITELVAKLPECTTGKITVVFEGDPRGATVRLIVPGSDGRPSTEVYP